MKGPDNRQSHENWSKNVRFFHYLAVKFVCGMIEIIVAHAAIVAQCHYCWKYRTVNFVLFLQNEYFDADCEQCAVFGAAQDKQADGEQCTVFGAENFETISDAAETVSTTVTRFNGDIQISKTVTNIIPSKKTFKY